MKKIKDGQGILPARKIPGGDLIPDQGNKSPVGSVMTTNLPSSVSKVPSAVTKTSAGMPETA